MAPLGGILGARRGTRGEARSRTAAVREPPAPARSPLLAPELMARVRQIKIRTHRLVNTALSGGYRSTFRGSGLEFSEVRAYQPGDDVRRIDWNVTARTGEAFVKTYAEERELTINLVVDTSRSMDFGSGRFTKRETAAQFCALISFVAMRHQDRVGLVMFGDEVGLHLRARKGGQHVLRVVREVIAAGPTEGGSDIAAVLEHELRALRRRAVVFLVSDFLDHPSGGSAPLRGSASPGWPDLLARLNRRHDVIAVRVFDPFEVDLPPAGVIGLQEIETGGAVELDTRRSSVRDAWREAAARRRSDLQAALSRARVELIELDTTRDIGDPILSFFRRRAARHGGAR